MCARHFEANRDNQSMNRRHFRIFNFSSINVQYCPLSQIMGIQYDCTKYKKERIQKTLHWAI
jgi:hypothetical protein